MSLNPPPAVRKIVKRLEDAGFETWCVGGAVRDALLGHPHLDWDLATRATPQEVRKLFKSTVPVGIDFGTIGVLDENKIMHEVTTFRRDVQTDGRHAVVEFGASLDDDLARRDYTINAIAYSPSRDEIRDPYKGQQDLEGRLIRAVGDARERMREDRLRALRAIRFASRFGFDIERDTYDAIVESAPELTRLSAERVKQEIEKTMDQVKFPSKAFAMWRDTGAFQIRRANDPDEENGDQGGEDRAHHPHEDASRLADPAEQIEQPIQPRRVRGGPLRVVFFLRPAQCVDVAAELQVGIVLELFDRGADGGRAVGATVSLVDRGRRDLRGRDDPIRRGHGRRLRAKRPGARQQQRRGKRCLQCLLTA